MAWVLTGIAGMRPSYPPLNHDRMPCGASSLLGVTDFYINIPLGLFNKTIETEKIGKSGETNWKLVSLAAPPQALSRRCR